MDFSLPAEICFNIFELFDNVDDVKNLSLVCKRFYEIVGKSDAMNLLVLRLHGDMDLQARSKIMASARNYKFIQLHYFNNSLQSTKFSMLIEKLGRNLRKLDIRKCYLTRKDLIELLKLTKNNLTALCISCSNIEEASDFAYESFKLNKLETLEVENTNCDILSILLDLVPDSLKQIGFECYTNRIGSSIAAIVGKQKNLKVLNIALSDFHSFSRVFNLEVMKMLKLESIYIFSRSSRCFTINPDLLEFVKSQTDYLRSLHLSNLPVENNCLEIFAEFMPNLEMLCIENPTCCPSFRNGKAFGCPSLKSMILDFPFTNTSSRNCSNLVRRFSNVNLNEITVKTKANYALLQSIAEVHPNLKKLELSEFIDDSFQHVVFEKIEEFIISGAVDGQLNDMNFLLGAMQNLKILRILGNVQIDSKSLLCLLKNSKLEVLEIENGSQLKNLCKRSNYFANLKFLSIKNYDESDIEKFRHKLRQLPGLKLSRVTSSLPVPDYHYFNFSEDEDFGYSRHEDCREVGLVGLYDQANCVIS